MPTNRPDPPQRRGFHVALSPDKSATILISQYLDKRIGDCKGSDERDACKRFVRQLNNLIDETRRWNEETAWNWMPSRPMPTLRAVAGRKYGTAEIRVFLPGRGHLSDMPTLVIPMTGTLRHIVRETSDIRIDIEADPSPYNPNSPARRGFPPKPEAELITGR